MLFTTSAFLRRGEFTQAAEVLIKSRIREAPSIFLLSIPMVKKQRIMSHEKEPISQVMSGDITSEMAQQTKQTTWMLIAECCCLLLEWICENSSSVSLLFCSEALILMKFNRLLSSLAASSLRQLPRGSRKQTKLAITLQPSSTITTSASITTRAVMTYEGWILQFLYRKVRESCWSIFSKLITFINLWESCLTFCRRGSSDI